MHVFLLGYCISNRGGALTIENPIEIPNTWHTKRHIFIYTVAFIGKQWIEMKSRESKKAILKS